jgi:hypothetical protein
MLVSPWSRIRRQIGRANEIRNRTDQFHPPFEPAFGAVLAHSDASQRIHAQHPNADHRID